MKLLGLILSTAVFGFGFVSSASACLVPPPASPEVMASRVLTYQTDLWTQSGAVFIARSEQPARVEFGFRATLVPVLKLKGPEVDTDIVIAHNAWTSCGPSPFLDALNGRSDQYYVVYSSEMTPTSGSITATIPLSDLVDPHALQGWSEAVIALQ